MPTKLRPPQVDYIQPSRSSTTHRVVEPTKLYILEIPPNPVKRPEHPVFLESSYDTILSSTTTEPTESLTFGVVTDRKKQQHSTILRTEMQKTHKLKATEYSAVNDTRSGESSIIVTRVDSSISKVTNTLITRPDDKASSDTTDSIAQFTKNVVRPAIGTAGKNGSNSITRMKPKEVRSAFKYIYLISITCISQKIFNINYYNI